MEEAVHLEKISKKFCLRHEHEATVTQAVINVFRGKSSTEEFWALKNISVSISKGEIVGIIGRNGSGKSSLLRIMAGILAPDYGHIKIRGHLASFLDLGAGFHPDLNGRENIYILGTILGMTHSDIQAVYQRIVDFSGLGKFIDIPIRNYSSGMAARLGFSVAASINPDILLIDEILSVGDYIFQQKCFNRLEELKLQQKTIIIVSHSLTEIEKLCTRAICLHRGEIFADGEVACVSQAYLRHMQEQDDEWKREILRQEEVEKALEQEAAVRERERREKEALMSRIRQMELDQEQRRKEYVIHWQLEQERMIQKQRDVISRFEEEREKTEQIKRQYEELIVRQDQEVKELKEELRIAFRKERDELIQKFENLVNEQLEAKHRLALEQGLGADRSEWLGALVNPGRWGDKQLEITSVSFKNSDGEEVSRFIAGESLTITIQFTAHQEAPTVVFRILVFRDDGFFMYGLNTARIGWQLTHIQGQGKLQIRFPELFLLKGAYKVTVGAWPDEKTSFQENRPFDVYSYLFQFTVEAAEDLGGGALYMPVIWRLEMEKEVEHVYTYTRSLKPDMALGNDSVV